MYKKALERVVRLGLKSKNNISEYPNRHCLRFFYTLLEAYYALYKEEKISEEEYLVYIKPIDKAIDTIELSTLQYSPAQKELFLLQLLELKN